MHCRRRTRKPSLRQGTLVASSSSVVSGVLRCKAYSQLPAAQSPDVALHQTIWTANTISPSIIHLCCLGLMGSCSPNHLEGSSLREVGVVCCCSVGNLSKGLEVTLN